MSKEAAQELIDLGYTNISHLSGGMREWQSNGLEIVRKP
jgi:rhodanese-related sulfurtransferase